MSDVEFLSRLEHASVEVNGTTIHTAAAGDGEPVLLLPGWPQTWYAWRKVGPRLVAARRKVVIADPRGLGRSAKPATGYDLDSAAADMAELIGQLGLDAGGGIDVVSHDIGAAVAYALASRWPSVVRRLVLSEVTLPRGGDAMPIPDDSLNVRVWHFGFNRLHGLPELLVRGRERVYLDWLFDNKSVRPDAIDAAARAEYADSFAAPDAARAGFDYYRELYGKAGLRRMAERLGTSLRMPVLALCADGGVGDRLARILAGSAENLRSVIVLDCGHYMPEEDPAAFTDAVLDFWAANATATSPRGAA